MKNMRILRGRNKKFKKVKIVSAYQESNKKRFNKIIIVINKYIINIPSLFS
jgi:hypothetical protein